MVESHLEACPTCPPLYAALVDTHDHLAGCRDPDSVIPPELETISITPATPVTLNEAGATQQYTATCIYAGGASFDCTADENLVWASSETDFATISNADGSEGLATAVATGTTSITATMAINGTLP